jgi:hypothetical protein
MIMPASTDDYLLATGKLVSNAAVTDVLMFSAFQILSSCEVRIATAIFYALDSFPPRKQMLTRVMNVGGDEEDKQYVSAIIAAAEKANNQRKVVAHSLASFESADMKGKFVLHNPKSQTYDKKPVTKKYLKSLISLSSEAVQSGLQAFQSLCKKHVVPPTPSF